MEVQIRRIQASDGELLSRLRLAALLDSPSAFASTYESEASRSSEEWTSRAVQDSSGPASATFVAICDQAPVGLIAVYQPQDRLDVVELVSMWTVPPFRRRGAGSALVRKAIEWARSMNYLEVILWVTDSNNGARALYVREGFVNTGSVQPLPSDPTLQESEMLFSLSRP